MKQVLHLVGSSTVTDMPGHKNDTPLCVLGQGDFSKGYYGKTKQAAGTRRLSQDHAHSVIVIETQEKH